MWIGLGYLPHIWIFIGYVDMCKAMDIQWMSIGYVDMWISVGYLPHIWTSLDMWICG